MKMTKVFILTLALVGFLFPGALIAAPKSDSATYNQGASRRDISVQCGATNSFGNLFRPTAFTVYITMSNRGDLGGMDGFVRVTYEDGDFIEYAVPLNTTLQITLSGGGIPNVDQIITVSGTGGAVLVGQMSLLTEQGKPHKDLLGQTRTPTIFCSTQVAP